MLEIYAKGEAYLSPDEFVEGTQSLSGLLRAREDVRRVRRHIARGALLEIGPGRGTFLAAARRRGFDVYGVELNPIQREFIGEHYGIPCVDSLEAASDLNGGQFDLIYHRDVLSHFYDPHAEMANLRALLRPGGFHIFETGNLADVDHRYLRLIRSFQYPDHLFFYGDRSLALLLEQTGFDHVRTYRYSVLPERWVRSKLTRLRGGANAASVEQHGHDAAPTGAEGAASSLGALARQSLDLFYYGLHRTVDALPTGTEVPQTLIVVARRR